MYDNQHIERLREAAEYALNPSFKEPTPSVNELAITVLEIAAAINADYEELCADYNELWEFETGVRESNED